MSAKTGAGAARTQPRADCRAGRKEGFQDVATGSDTSSKRERLRGVLGIANLCKLALLLREEAMNILRVAPIVFALCSPALAQETVAWSSGEVRGWSILVDRTMGNGCFITAVFEGDTALRLGFDMSQGWTGYLLIGNANWQSIEDGKSYDLAIQFDRAPVWDAPATGWWMGDLPGLLVTFSDPQFVEEFARLHGVAIWYGNTELGTFSLAGSAAAVSEMIVCQQAINESMGGASNASIDPFAGPSNRTTTDPFAR